MSETEISIESPEEKRRRELLESNRTADALRQKALDEKSQKFRSEQKAKQESLKTAKKGVVTPVVENRTGDHVLSAKGAERRIQKEGLENVGRNPEDVVAQEKRTDWDPNKG